jgi:hypothetical protein
MKTFEERCEKSSREICEGIQKAGGHASRDAIYEHAVREAEEIAKKWGRPVNKALDGIWAADNFAALQKYEDAPVAKLSQSQRATISVTPHEGIILDKLARGEPITNREYELYEIEKQNKDFITVPSPLPAGGFRSDQVALKRKSKGADLNDDENDDEADVDDKRGKKRKGKMLDAESDRGESLSSWDAHPSCGGPDSGMLARR